jgi:hypothetical protein
MVTWRIVDDDVECLHVERNPIMTCSGSHLYKFYRFLHHAGAWIPSQHHISPAMASQPSGSEPSGRADCAGARRGVREPRRACTRSASLRSRDVRDADESRAGTRGAHRGRGEPVRTAGAVLS